MKIIKSEVSFKSDVALVVVGQDTNSPSNATPRDLQGEVELFQVVSTAAQLLSLVWDGGSCSLFQGKQALQFLPWSVDFLQAVKNSEESNAVK